MQQRGTTMFMDIINKVDVTFLTNVLTMLFGSIFGLTLKHLWTNTLKNITNVLMKSKNYKNRFTTFILVFISIVIVVTLLGMVTMTVLLSWVKDNIYLNLLVSLVMSFMGPSIFYGMVHTEVDKDSVPETIHNIFTGLFGKKGINIKSDNTGSNIYDTVESITDHTDTSGENGHNI